MFDDDSKKKNSDSPELEASGKGINLLPEEMRSKEDKAKQGKSNFSMELRTPKFQKKAKEEKVKLPWLSFWKKKDKEEAPEMTESPEPEKQDRPKVKFSIIGKKRKHHEQAKEEAFKQEILATVGTSKKDLPAHDHSLFNQKVEPTKKEVTDMFEVGPVKPEVPQKTDDSRTMLEDRVVVPEAVAPLPEIEPTLENVTQQKPVAPRPDEPVTPDVIQRPVSTQSEKDSMPLEEGLDATMEVNLIPTSLRVRSWQQIVRSFIITGLIIVIFSGLAYGALIVWSQQIENQSVEIDSEIKKVRTRILAFETLQNDIALMESQVSNVTSLLDEHIYWTKFFDLIEKYTLEDVYYEGLSVGINGNLSLAAHGTDFTTAARQLLLFESAEARELVATVSITQVTQSTTGVTFAIDLSLNNNLFYNESVSEEN